MAEIPYGWLECNGQTVSRSMYSELFTKFSTQLYDDPSGTQDPTHTLLSRYGEGDGSTTFNLPDYRECALVGVGSNGTFIIDNTNQSHEVHTLGEFKDDQFQGHYHTYKYVSGIRGTDNPIHEIDVINLPLPSNAPTAPTRILEPISDNINGNPRYGTTTHGKQIGVTYFIKAL